MDFDSDGATLAAFPLAVASKKEGISKFQATNGTRFVATAGGVMREIVLPWVAVRHFAAFAVIDLPYGQLPTEVVFKCSPVPRLLWKQFRNDAVANLPNEMAAAMVWNEETESWRYALRESKSASPTHVRYDGEGLVLQDGEHIVVDLHSHGALPAFFSQEDNADDKYTMRLSGVLGHVETNQPSFVLRLNMPSVSWPALIGRDGEFEVKL